MSNLLKLIPRKLAYTALTAVAELGLAVLRAKFPGIPWPDTSTVAALGATLVGSHAATDIASIIANRTKNPST